VNDRKVFGETIPPLEGYVTAAEQNGGGPRA
jgi:hypothetical protein